MTVDQLQAEIARLHEVRNKVEAGYVETVAQLQEQLAAIQEDGEILLAEYGVMASEVPSTTPWLLDVLARLGGCRWTETKDGQWETACEQMHEFFDGGPKDNRLQFCGYCGKRLVEQRWSETGGEDGMTA